MVERVEIDPATKANNGLGDIGDKTWERTFLDLVCECGIPIENRCIEHEGLNVMGVGRAMLKHSNECTSL